MIISIGMKWWSVFLSGFGWKGGEKEKKGNPIDTQWMTIGDEANDVIRRKITSVNWMEFFVLSTIFPFLDRILKHVVLIMIAWTNCINKQIKHESPDTAMNEMIISTRVIRHVMNIDFWSFDSNTCSDTFDTCSDSVPSDSDWQVISFSSFDWSWLRISDADDWPDSVSSSIRASKSLSSSLLSLPGLIAEQKLVPGCRISTWVDGSCSWWPVDLERETEWERWRWRESERERQEERVRERQEERESEWERQKEKGMETHSDYGWG